MTGSGRMDRLTAGWRARSEQRVVIGGMIGESREIRVIYLA